MNHCPSCIGNRFTARWLSLAICCLAVVVAGGCATPAEPRTEAVVVAELGEDEATSTSDMTREELDEHIRRFSDRYRTRIAIATRMLTEESDNVELVRFMHDWRTISNESVIDIAIGPDSVTNLMDMMVLTMLSRLVVQDYWAPRIPDEELQAQFLEAFNDLETDIWTVADDVLTQEHQRSLATLVEEWHEENPEQIYPWYVRFGNFSGQRAASLNAVKQSGGMLQEVARARETAEELQAFLERMLFYLQRAPAITSGHFESSAGDVLGGPEVTMLLEDVNRFIVEMERFVTLAEGLPDSRIAAVDQMMDRLAEERIALMESMASSEPQLRSVLEQLLPVLESIERTVALAKTKDPDSKPFDINEYRSLVNDAAVTAGELRLLTQSIAGLVNDVAGVEGIEDTILEVQTELLDRFFLRMVGFLVLFFVLLLSSRFLWVRMSASQ